MPFCFGEFVLDEVRAHSRLPRRRAADAAARLRSPCLSRKECGRVVPKEELLDRLWPHVTVTEASLQRAVSLARSALAVGGMESASAPMFARLPLCGRRTKPGCRGAGIHAKDKNRAAALDLARAKDWKGAAAVFEKLDAAGELTAADIDVWALAVECQGRPVAAIPVLTRAVAAHVDEAQPHLAPAPQ